MSEQTLMNVSDLLDANLDDIADLPEFCTFPNGLYSLEIQWEEKEINNKPKVELKLNLLTVEELEDPTAEAPAAKSQSSILFSLDNEFGVGALKAVLKPLAAHFGTASPRSTMEASNGCTIVAALQAKKAKKGDGVFQHIKSLQVA